MDANEAAKVVKIMLTADHWCSVCQQNLLEQFDKAFPEHAPLADDLYKRSDALRAAHEAAVEQWQDGGWKGDKPSVCDMHVF